MKAAWWPPMMECGSLSAGDHTTHSLKKKKKKRQAGSASQSGWFARDREASPPQWMIIYAAEGAFQSSAAGRAAARLASTSTTKIAPKWICRKPAAQLWDGTRPRPNIIHPQWWRHSRLQPYICIYSLVLEVK